MSPGRGYPPNETPSMRVANDQIVIWACSQRPASQHRRLSSSSGRPPTRALPSG